MNKKLKNNILLRFEKYKRIDEKTGCWIWTAACCNGYGHISIRLNGMKKAKKVHRMSYLIYKDNRIKNKEICHTCDNPPCFNPDHLFKGNAKINSDDKIAKGRDRKAFGENHGQSVLTTKQVIKIKKLLKGKKYWNYQIADHFNVARVTIYKIKKGITWRHVEI